MLKRFIVMTFALLVAFSWLTVAADKGGRLTIVEPVKEYGEVPKGETGCFRLTTSNHWGGCEIHARTIAGVFV